MFLYIKEKAYIYYYAFLKSFDPSNENFASGNVKKNTEFLKIPKVCNGYEFKSNSSEVN